jgi:hypothetical protein
MREARAIVVDKQWQFPAGSGKLARRLIPKCDIPRNDTVPSCAVDMMIAS